MNLMFAGLLFGGFGGFDMMGDGLGAHRRRHRRRR